MEKVEYNTVAAPGVAEIKIEKSLFIGHTCEVRSQDEAHDFIAQIRAEHAQATHNCYAYVVGLGDDRLIHFHDHGEPSGTAGKPILGAIQRLDLTNTIVVVTRYFGGRKLGVRGLIDAYGKTATTVLEEVGISTRIITRSYRVIVDYPQLDTVQYLIEQAGGIVSNQEFTTRVTLVVALPINMAQSTIALLKEKQLVQTIAEAN